MHGSGGHYKGKERAVSLVIACLKTAKFLEPIEETVYRVSTFISLFIKRSRLLCVLFRRDRIGGGPVLQIGPDLFCAIGFFGKNIGKAQATRHLNLGNNLQIHPPVLTQIVTQVCAEACGRNG